MELYSFVRNRERVARTLSSISSRRLLRYSRTTRSRPAIGPHLPHAPTPQSSNRYSSSQVIRTTLKSPPLSTQIFALALERCSATQSLAVYVPVTLNRNEGNRNVLIFHYRSCVLSSLAQHHSTNLPFIRPPSGNCGASINSQQRHWHLQS